MHVKWKRRPGASGEGQKACSLDLLLLEKAPSGSEDRVVERLGTIEERFILCGEVALRTFHQGIFWQRLKQRLEALNLPPEAVRAAEEAAAEKIPLPPEGWALWPRQCSLSCAIAERE